MAETENIECPSCGAMVRPGASFCFKCGKHFELAGAQAVAGPAPAGPGGPGGPGGNDTGEPAEPVPAPAIGEFHETVPDIAAETAKENGISVDANPRNKIGGCITIQ